MASSSNPFKSIRWLACCSALFGMISVIVGISEMFVWLAVLGVFGDITKDQDGNSKQRLGIGDAFGGASGFTLVVLSACGLWCGLWVFCTGMCGCAMRAGQPRDKNNRTRIVVCIASGLNAVILCPVQIALYAYLFTPEDIWFNELYLVKPVWWAVMFQAIGITSGVASLIICIISIVVTLRTKPYAGEAKTWNEFDV